MSNAERHTLACENAGIQVGKLLAEMLDPPVNTCNFSHSPPTKMSPDARAKEFGLALAHLLLLVTGKKQSAMDVADLTASRRRKTEAAKAASGGQE